MEKDNRPVIVSIRCTVYNHEPYLRECLDGFVMQKTNFRFEAIVHDDASTDGSAAIIKEYAEKYPDIIKPILETENQYSKHDGSLQRIMDENMHGKYIALCEGDDYWIDSNKLQMQVDFLEKNPDYVLCFHNAIKHWDDGSCEDVFVMDNKYEDREYLPLELYQGWFYPTASFLYRREVQFCKVKHNFKSKKGITGDVPLMMSATTIGKVYGFTKVMSVYNLHQSGMTQRKDFYMFVIRQDMAIAEILGGDILTIWKSKKMKYAIAKSFFDFYEHKNCKLLKEVVQMAIKHYPFTCFYEAVIYNIKYINMKIKKMF